SAARTYQRGPPVPTTTSSSRASPESAPSMPRAALMLASSARGGTISARGCASVRRRHITRRSLPRLLPPLRLVEQAKERLPSIGLLCELVHVLHAGGELD